MTEVLNDSLDNASFWFVFKGEMQINEMTQESILSKFKTEVKSSQDNHLSLLQRETEKLKVDIEKMMEKLKSDLEKMRSELRRIRDELNDQNQETTNLTNKLDREIHALRAQIEAAKYDVIKYCIDSLASVAADGLAVIRILM
ncbi:coiled-coil domain-containing protein 90B [Striga asiatica]|uniref:Coiled-coil domain-containing protein 90B n=1 Tax=Striga asiatica TaxID=4170 RepID=A0A5A7PQP8_STRAF|nr:coiled-coil domain-containing protein 90B [Striga asiatica]